MLIEQRQAGRSRDGGFGDIAGFSADQVRMQPVREPQKTDYQGGLSLEWELLLADSCFAPA